MALQLVLLGILLIAAMWNGAQAARAPSSRLPRVLLLACFTLLAGGQAASLPPITARISQLTAPGDGKILYNGLTMAGLLALLLFFGQTTTSDPDARRYRVRWLDTAAFVSSFGAMVALMLATPVGLRNHSLQSPQTGLAQVAAFYIIGNLYFVYSYASAALCVHQYTRASGSRLSPLMLLALRKFLIAGLAGLSVTAVVRVVWVVLRFVHDEPSELVNAINWQAANVSFILVTLGLSLLGIVHGWKGLTAWRRKRRDHRVLGALWATVHDLYPEIALPRARSDRLTRRAYECHDGLVRLSPYIGLAARGRDLSTCSAGELAEYIRAAIALKPKIDESGLRLEAVNLQIPSPGVPDGHGRDLVAIARQLRKATAG